MNLKVVSNVGISIMCIHFERIFLKSTTLGGRILKSSALQYALKNY